MPMSLAQCFYDVNSARSKFYPNITISDTGAFTNSGGGGIVNPGKWLLSAVGSLTQPIFAHGQIVAGLKVAKAKQEQAYNTWQNAVLSAGSEVSNALVLYNSSDEKSKLEAKQVESLKKNVEYNKMLFNDGSATSERATDHIAGEIDGAGIAMLHADAPFSTCTPAMFIRPLMPCAARIRHRFLMTFRSW